MDKVLFFANFKNLIHDIYRTGRMEDFKFNITPNYTEEEHKMIDDSLNNIQEIVALKGFAYKLYERDRKAHYEFIVKLTGDLFMFNESIKN